MTRVGYVINRLPKPLLSLEVSETFDIVKFDNNINNLQVNTNDLQSYTKVKVLGKIKGTISIKLWPNAIPFAQTVPRIVPIPIKEKLKLELQRLQRLDV